MLYVDDNHFFFLFKWDTSTASICAANFIVAARRKHKEEQEEIELTALAWVVVLLLLLVSLNRVAVVNVAIC